MRNDEEQLRHMEKQHAKGELNELQVERMKRLRQIVQDKGGEVRQMSREDQRPAHKEGEGLKFTKYGPEYSGSYNLWEKLGLKKTEAQKQRESRLKDIYEESLYREREKVERIRAKKKAREALKPGHSTNPLGNIGKSFLKASMSEIGGLAGGAAEFNAYGMGGGYSSGGGKRRRKGKKIRRGGDFGMSDYMPSSDLIDFI